MRNDRSNLAHDPIPEGEAVVALAGILNQMNGRSAGDIDAPADDPDPECIGYQVEASAILDQLIAQGFVITRID